jgi:hypothetical protein
MGKRKSMKGGSLINQSNSIVNILLVLLVGLLAYNLLNQPQVIIQEKPKVIIKEIVKEDDEGEPYREDIYIPDRKRRINKPFNYPTRGPPEEYDMVGFLQDSDDPNKLQQLYGRRTYPNSNSWNYFVKSDQYHQIPIPVTLDGKNCTDETGCKELQNNDNINLLNKEHTATIYKPEPYYYNPHVL